MHKGDTPRTSEMLNRTSAKPKHLERDLTDAELAYIEGQLQGDGKLGAGVRFEIQRRAAGLANIISKWAICISLISLAVVVVSEFW